jgi:hypothetical protein
MKNINQRSPPQKWVDINTFHSLSLVSLEERLGLKGDSHMALEDEGVDPKLDTPEENVGSTSPNVVLKDTSLLRQVRG